MPIFTRYVEVLKDKVWSKVLTLALILFFLCLSDGILSFWAPNLLEDIFKSPITMGFIISFNSVIGFGADLIFPQIFKSISVKNLLWGAVFGIVGFAFLMLLGIKLPLIIIFLLAVSVWGLYYEFFGFASQQFVADTVPFRMHSSSWGLLSVFRNLSYFLAPMLAGWLMLEGEAVPAWGAIGFGIIAGAILIFVRRVQNRPLEIDFRGLNLILEISYWKTLICHIWPMIAISFVVWIIDAFIWTTGAVWTEKLVKENFWGALIIPAYQLPALFMGFIVAKLGIYEGKKKLAIKFLLLAGIFLAALGLTDVVSVHVILIFACSLMLSVTHPLADGVYSDLVARLLNKKDHLIGLSSSTINVAYIVGPILAGFLASSFGERMAFSYIGIATVAISVLLLIFTPKKLRLPQTEIETWKK